MEPLLLTTTNESIYTFQPYTVNEFNSTYLNKKLYLRYELDNSPTVTIETTRFTFFQDATVNVVDTRYGIFSTVTSTLTIAASPIPDFNVYLYSVSGNLDRIKLTKTNKSTYTFQPYTVNEFNSTYLNKELYLQYELVDSRTFTIETTRFTLFQDATVSLVDTSYGIFSTVTSTLTIAASPIPDFNVYLYSVSGNLDRIKLTKTNKSTYTFQPYTVNEFNSTYLNKELYLQYELVDSPTFTIRTTPFTIFQNATVAVELDKYGIFSKVSSTLTIAALTAESLAFPSFNVYLYHEPDTLNRLTLPATAQSSYTFQPYKNTLFNSTYLNEKFYLLYVLDGSSTITIRTTSFTISQNATVAVPNEEYGIFSKVSSTLTIATLTAESLPFPFFDVYLYHEPDTLNPLTLSATNKSSYTFQPYKNTLFNSTYLNEKFYLLYVLDGSSTITIRTTSFTISQNATVAVPNEEYGIFSKVSSTLTIATLTAESLPFPFFDVYLYHEPDTLNPLTLSATNKSSYTFQPYKNPLFKSTYLNEKFYLLYVLDGSSTITIRTTSFTISQNATVAVPNEEYGIFSKVSSTLTIATLTAESLPFPFFDVYLYHKPDTSNPKMLKPLQLTETDQSIYTFQPYTVNEFNSTYLNKKLYLRYELLNSPTITIETTPFTLFQDATVAVELDKYGIFSTVKSRLTIAALTAESLPFPYFKVYLYHERNTLKPLLIDTINHSIYTFQPYKVNEFNSTYLNEKFYLLYELVNSPTITIETTQVQTSRMQ